jgi:hypothetical protein
MENRGVGDRRNGSGQAQGGESGKDQVLHRNSPNDVQHAQVSLLGLPDYEGVPTGEIFGWQTWSGIVMSVDLLARCSSAAHACAMFSVDEATAAAIRQVFEESGELSAVVELWRHFPGSRTTQPPGFA